MFWNPSHLIKLQMKLSFETPCWIGTYSLLLLSAGLHSFAMSSFDERRQAKRFLIANTVLQRRSVNPLSQLAGKDYYFNGFQRNYYLTKFAMPANRRKIEKKKNKKKGRVFSKITFKGRIERTSLSKFNTVFNELAAFMLWSSWFETREICFLATGRFLRFLNITRETDLSSFDPSALDHCVWCLTFFLYLTSLASILFGFDQLASGLAHVVAGLIHAVLNAVHHLTLPYRTWEDGRSRSRMEDKGEEGDMWGFRGWDQVHSSRGTTSGEGGTGCAPRVTFMYT